MSHPSRAHLAQPLVYRKLFLASYARCLFQFAPRLQDVRDLVLSNSEFAIVIFPFRLCGIDLRRVHGEQRITQLPKWARAKDLFRMVRLYQCF